MERGETRGEVGARGPVICLLAHGFNGDPSDMAELDERLRAAGFATRNLLLPGHGATVREFAAAGWDDWLAALRWEAYDALAQGGRVILIGHSLGAALMLAVAATVPEVSGVVALCPPLALWPALLPAVRVLRRVLPYVPSRGEDVRDRRGARQRGFARRTRRWIALRTSESLLRALPALPALLPRVRCPALVFCARHDHVVPYRDGIETYRLLGSEHKELVVLRRSFHVVTKDIERELVFRRTCAFCTEIGG